MRIGAGLAAALLHAIVFAALITMHTAEPVAVPETVALRLIAQPAAQNVPPPPEIAPPVLARPAAPFIAPPDVPPLAVSHAALRRLPAPPRTVPAEAPGSPAKTVRPVTAAPAPQSPGAESHTWQDRLSAWLQAHRVYPDAARRAGEEGSPAIRFTIARDGRVTAVSLVRTSGVKRLDSAALAMLDHALVPPLPPDFPESVTVTISLRYALKE